MGQVPLSRRTRQRVAGLDDRRLVLFVDELQVPGAARAPFGDADRVTKVMRAVLQGSDRVTTLVAGRLEHMTRDLFAPAIRAFSRWSGWHALRPIEDVVWLGGLRERFAREDLDLTDEVGVHLLAKGPAEKVRGRSGWVVGGEPAPQAPPRGALTPGTGPGGAGSWRSRATPPHRRDAGAPGAVTLRAAGSRPRSAPPHRSPRA